MPKKSHMVLIVGAVALVLAGSAGVLWFVRGTDIDTLDSGDMAGSMRDVLRGWPVEFKTVEWSTSGPYRDRIEALVKSEEDWVRLNERQHNFSPPSLPTVDWQRNSLVLIVLEDKPGRAREMEIVGVRLDGSEVLVDVQVREVDGVAVGSPFHLIEVPASEAGNVVVREVPIENGDSEEPGPKATTWGRLKSKFSS